MELYDLEFAHRLAVHAAALEHIGSADAPLLAEPIACRQCDMCQWRGWCAERLEETADLSLLSGVGVARRRLYKSNGVEDLHDLAALDWTTAELLRRKVDLVDLRARVARPSRIDALGHRHPEAEEAAPGLGVARLRHRG